MGELCVVLRRQEMTAAPLTSPLSPQESGVRTAWGLLRTDRFFLTKHLISDLEIKLQTRSSTMETLDM